jgi:site-specific DNA recombinase
MKPAVIYLRVSTARQAEEGVSMDAQAAKAKAYCEMNGFEVIATLQDSGISGSKMKTRPGLLAAIEAVCKAKGVLVVYSLSRMARSTRDALEISEKLCKAGADLCSLTERLDTTTAAGKMVFRMMAVLAEFERDLVSERTRAALDYKRKKGEKTGGHVNYGYDAHVDAQGTFVLYQNKDEMENICYMMHLKTRNYSYSEIAKVLDGKGLKAKLGGKWSAKTVRDVIMQEKQRREAEGE